MAELLCTGEYELSQNSTDNSKEYFFVKLTDSAYRAIEEYKKGKHNNKPATIQILENGGLISFPSSVGNVDQQFSFSTDKIDSFECIQQRQNKLDVLGALPYKMRIHANNDVFEKTRHRMAVAEENQKNKCTQEIKPNQKDIGRKVKLENKYTHQQNIAHKRDQILTRTTIKSPISSSNFSFNPTSSNIPPPKVSTAIQSPSSANVNALSSTIYGLDADSAIFPSSLSISAKPTPLSASSSSFSISSVTSAHAISSSNDNLKSITSKRNSMSKISHKINSTSKKLPASAFSSPADSGSSIAVRSSCNRNIYNKDGLKTTNVAIGNKSNKIRHGGSVEIINSNNIRNGKNVNRDVPDITKKKIRDRIIHLLALKPYKKPELYSKLTNQGIRDREKTSINGILKDISTIRHNTYNLKNHLWNEVNEEWPFYSEQELQMLKRRKPQNRTTSLSSDGGGSSSSDRTLNVSPQPALKGPSMDRNRFYEEPTAKKQRISLFRKDTNENNSSKVIPTKHDHKLEDNAISISFGVLRNDETRRLPQIEEMISGQSIRDRQQNIISSHQNSSSSVISKNIGNSHYNNYSQTNYNSSSNHLQLLNNVGDKCEKNFSASSLSMTNANISPGVGTLPGRNIYIDISNTTEGNTMTLNDERSNDTGYNHQNNSTSSNMSNGKEGSPATNAPHYDFSRFTFITTIDQRRLYKSEFERSYSEYLDLLNKIKTVGRKFHMSAEQLNNQKDNIETTKDVMKQLSREYEKINQNKEHQKEKARFEYLHAKLAHIKYLVSEFDKTLCGGTASASSL